MNRLRQLSSTLQNIEETSKKLLRRSLPILEQLTDEDNELVSSVIEEYEGNIDVDRATHLLRELTLEMIGDAETCTKEIDAFGTHILEGEESLQNNEQLYPHLSQVWFGDVYSTEGVEALNVLLDELRAYLKNMNDDYIIDETLRRLNV